MESKIQIDVDYEMNPSITLKHKTTDDVRDRLVALFIQKAVPKDMSYEGFARVSRLHMDDDGTLLAEVIPIHPIDMPKWIDRIRENAAKFETAVDQPQLERNENPEMDFAEALEMVDLACVTK